MVTLQQYDEFTGKTYNPIEKFEGFLTEFNNSWNKFSTPEDKGIRIKQGSVILFFMDFNWKKLNFPEKNKLEHVKKFVTNLKLRTDSENNVYYLDVVLKVLINTMGTQVDRDNPDNALILRTEKKTQEEINEIIDGYMKRDKKEKNKKNIVITFNPLTTHIYFKMTYHYMKASDEIKVNEKYKTEFKEILKNNNISSIEGKVWTTDAPYRETRNKVLKRKEQGCICVDMECSAMNAVAKFRNKELFQFFYAADNLDSAKWNQRSLGNDDRLSEKEKIIYLAFELALKM